jgi:hypothetical protein
MNKEDINKRCLCLAESLLHKYFGNLVKEATIDKPEDIGQYDLELPLRIEAEYKVSLKQLWEAYAPDNSRNFDNIFDKADMRQILTTDDLEGLSYAYKDAKRITLWEKITQTNHRDVTFYKGLLEEYTRELLFCMRHDFIEEFPK